MDYYKDQSLSDLTVYIPYNKYIGDPYSSDTHLVEIKEEWSPIPGFNNLYLISNIGRVRSMPRVVSSWKGEKRTKECIMKLRINHRGYLKVNIHNKYYSIHKLLALTHIPNPENKATVNHKYPDKLINIPTNLEWLTNRENIEHSIKYRCFLNNKTDGVAPRKRKKIQQFTIDGQFIKEWEKGIDIHIKGVSQNCVRRVCNGLQPQHKGFIWRYVSC